MIILKSLICAIGCISLMAVIAFFTSGERIQCTLGDLLILLGFFFVFYSIFSCPCMCIY